MREREEKKKNLHWVQSRSEETMLDLVSAQIVWGKIDKQLLTAVI